MSASPNVFTYKIKRYVTDIILLFHLILWSIILSSLFSGHHTRVFIQCHILVIGCSKTVRSVLSCHCHVFVRCSSKVLYAARGQTTTKWTAPCKARKNDLFSLDPQEQKTLPGRNKPIASGRLFIPCACLLLTTAVYQKGNSTGLLLAQIRIWDSPDVHATPALYLLGKYLPSSNKRCPIHAIQCYTATLDALQSFSM